jgi:hypothetical protein
MNRFYLLYGVFLLITSCTKVVDIDFPEPDNKIAICCFFTPDSVFKVLINKTSAVLDDSVYYEQNARLTLFEDGNYFDTLTYENLGWYHSSKSPATGKNYDIKIFIPGIPEVTSTDKIPAKTLISGVSYKDSAMYDADGYYSEVSMLFSDNINEKNYYELFLMTFNTDSDSNGFNQIVSCEYDKITDNVLKAEGLLNYEPATFVFSDALINGMTHEIKLYIWKPVITEHSKIIVVFRSISESLYNYKRKLTLHINNQQGSIWNGVGEPVPMFSNINNGYGIFAGYSCDTDTLSIP